MLRLRCSSRLPNSRLPVRRLCSRGRCGSDRIVRTDSVYLGTAVTRQNFAPVVIASRCYPCACLVLRLRCSSRLPNSMLSVRSLCSRGRCGSDSIVRTDSVYPGTAVTQQSFAPVISASRYCPVLIVLTRTFLERTNMRAGSSSHRAATHT